MLMKRGERCLLEVSGLQRFVLGSGQDLPVPLGAWLPEKLRHGGAGQDLLEWD